MDMITALPKPPQRNDAVVVFVDRLIKLVHFAPCKKSITAKQMAHLLVCEVIRQHGWPKAIVSDRDPCFDADFWRAVLQGSGTQLRLSTPSNPQTDGQTERSNRTLLQMLRAFCVPAKDGEWEFQLPWLEFAYNNAEQSSTGYSPFFLNSGTHPLTPLQGLFSPSSAAIHESSPAGRGYTARLREALAIAKSNLQSG